MQEVLQCLKKHGQRLDLEIAAEMRVPLATVRKLLAELSAAGEVMCQLTRYEGSKTIEAWQCWISGYVPALTPGRKPKAAQWTGRSTPARVQLSISEWNPRGLPACERRGLRAF